MAFFSTTLTVATTIQPVIANKPDLRTVKQAVIVVRSMGTATFVGLGGRDSQDRQLKAVGDFLSISANYPAVTVDLRSLFAISDTADAVIEVFGEA